VSINPNQLTAKENKIPTTFVSYFRWAIPQNWIVAVTATAGSIGKHLMRDRVIPQTQFLQIPMKLQDASLLDEAVTSLWSELLVRPAL